jgi:hypothetical protein
MGLLSVEEAAARSARHVTWLRPSVGRRAAHCLRVTTRYVSYVSCYVYDMADTITFRPDEDTQRALAALTADGTPVSTAVRSALIAAARARAGQVLRAEAEALADDEDDRAEATRVLQDMETLRAW